LNMFETTFITAIINEYKPMGENIYENVQMGPPRPHALAMLGHTN